MSDSLRDKSFKELVESVSNAWGDSSDSDSEYESNDSAVPTSVPTANTRSRSSRISYSGVQSNGQHNNYTTRQRYNASTRRVKQRTTIPSDKPTISNMTRVQITDDIGDTSVRSYQVVAIHVTTLKRLILRHITSPNSKHLYLSTELQTYEIPPEVGANDDTYIDTTLYVQYSLITANKIMDFDKANCGIQLYDTLYNREWPRIGNYFFGVIEYYVDDHLYNLAIKWTCSDRSIIPDYYDVPVVEDILFSVTQDMCKPYKPALPVDKRTYTSNERYNLMRSSLGMVKFDYPNLYNDYTTINPSYTPFHRILDDTKYFTATPWIAAVNHKIIAQNRQLAFLLRNELLKPYLEKDDKLEYKLRCIATLFKYAEAFEIDYVSYMELTHYKYILRGRKCKECYYTIPVFSKGKYMDTMIYGEAPTDDNPFEQLVTLWNKYFNLIDNASIRILDTVD